MRRRLIAIGCGGWLVAALGLVACSGDDTNPAAADAGADATMSSDGSGGDATSAGDGGAPDADASDDDALSCAVDAGTYTDAEVQAGFAIVKARKCQTCHGDDLQGNQNGVPSTNADGGTAYPPDLTPDPATGLGCWTNGQIARAFLHGIDKEGEPMCNPMPRFGEEGDAGIDEAGAGAVIAYLRSIPAVVNAHVPKNPACPPAPPVDAGQDSGPDAEADAGEDSGLDATADASDATVSDAAPDADDGGDGGD